MTTQLTNLQTTFVQYKTEHEPTKNTGLSLVDAQILYSFVRREKPRLMIEIGGGVTTLMSLAALHKNRQDGHEYNFITIDPYPNAGLQKIKDSGFKLIIEKVQKVDVSTFKNADLLFIDSSHVCKFGSDVNYEILEIAPRLKPGALIHWHDILFSSEYWKEWILDAHYFWNESYFVHTFMSYNESFQIEWASRFMQLNYNSVIENSFSYYSTQDHLSSFWVRKVK